MKLGVVVVTHGQLATELVNSAEMIVGDFPDFTAVSIGWHEDVDHAKEEIGRAIARVQGTAGRGEEKAGVLVLTDMFGGTPANLAVTFVSPTVEVITRDSRICAIGGMFSTVGTIPASAQRTA